MRKIWGIFLAAAVLLSGCKRYDPVETTETPPPVVVQEESTGSGALETEQETEGAAAPEPVEVTTAEEPEPPERRPVKVKGIYLSAHVAGNEEKMQQAFESLYEQAEKSLSAVDFDKYDEILFVAKSVGTIIASAYAEKHSIRCRQILYTPLKYTYNFAHRDAIAFIGTSDPWSIVSEVQAFSQKQQVPMYTYENANHSLETTDTLENLKILQDVMGKTKGFLERK